MGQGQSTDGAGNACVTKSEETTLECVVKSEDTDRLAIEKKLKEVICKTVINIPLTEGKSADEPKTNLVPESSSSCVDIDGKLLIKVMKASGLTGIEKTDIPDVYCMVTSKEPPQKKKTNTIKATKDPVWNESHVLDVTSKTKEITFDIFNELKTTEGSDFLGQVIVPLVMIGKDQTCRLILPILPTSTKNSYVTGQIHLEFTYDKDGKVFEKPTEESSSTTLPSTPDEIPKASQQKSKVVVEEARPSSPQRLVFSMATLDIVEDDDNLPQFVPLVDHGIGRQDIVEAEKKIEERSTHGGYETDPGLIEENRKHHEMLEELIELDRRAASGNFSNVEENEKKTEPVETIRPSSQRSQKSPEATSPVDPVVVYQEKPEVSSNDVEKTTQPVDNIEGVVTRHDKEPLVLNEKLMDDLTPDTRRKAFRKAFSMRITRNNEGVSEKINTDAPKTKSNDIEKRYLFGEEKSQPIEKSVSDASLDSTKSTLVVETSERGQIKYYQIPSLMAKRGTFDHKGTKLHVFNDHLFVATHFTGDLPSCCVCKSPLTGHFGKQGYKCRDCQMIAHKHCHYDEKVTACTNSSLSSLKIKKAASIYGYK